MDSTIASLGRSLFGIALAGYAISALVYLAYILVPKQVPKWLPSTVLAIVSVINIGIVVFRAAESGRSPMASRYESVTFFGMFIGIVYVFTEWRLKIRFGGLFASLIAFGLFMYVVLVDLDQTGVPITMANIVFLMKTGGTQMKSMPLQPALQSPWFFWHVSLAFLGYSFFTTAFISEITSACLSAGRSEKYMTTIRNSAIAFGVGFILWLFGGQVVAVGVIAYPVMTISLMVIIGVLLGVRHNIVLPHSDEEVKRVAKFAYSHVLFAFPLLTWCVVSGGAWADKAWGTYWGWDAKEIWSLITFFIYAAYFHMVGHPRWRGRTASIVHVAGFVSVLTTYLMVNYLVEWFDLFSLHAYTA